MQVFISHSSKDKPAVEALAVALRERGIDPWLDKWEIRASDDIVASINAGLDKAGAGIIVFSRHSRESRWVDAEVSYLTYARIQEQKVLIPVMLGEDCYVPPLLRPLARRGIDEVDAIVDALLLRKAKPVPARAPEQGRVERVLISLRRDGSGIRSELRIGAQVHGEAVFSAMPKGLAAAQAAFLQGFRHGLRRDLAEADRQSYQAQLAHLGSALGELCFPDNSGAALAALIDGGSPVGTTVEVCWEADDPELLGLPFEATCLPDGRVLALQPPVVMMRRPVGLNGSVEPAFAGPLKILVAVAAPDEGVSSGAVLDQERELQNILDAVEPARHLENCQVRILEVGHPVVIGGAVERDAYHVLHLSCHGLPGALELEDEEGGALRTSAAELLAPIRQVGRPLPLVLLNACHSGVAPEETASLAEALLRGGIPAVVAMQAPVSDYYAIGLAKSFYLHLAKRENFLPSRALADARKEQERLRVDAARRGAPLEETQPEFATAALYVAGDERPLADFALDNCPLRSRPVYEVPGPVQQLRVDDLIGRRRELRETLRSLRDAQRHHAGVVLSGIGGAGKSAVAGRVMCRLTEDGWMVAAHRGRFDLAAIAVVIGAALLQSDREPTRKRGELLTHPNLDDRVRLELLGQVLTEERILLVLDDFEANLATGGDAFLDDDVAIYLRFLAESARNGRLLITSRHSVPGTGAYLRRIPIGPLSLAQTRKLLLRLPGLAGSDLAATATVLRVIGGHPRVLEFLDALLRGGQGRFPAVTEKLLGIAKTLQLDLATASRVIADATHTALIIAAGDVLLDELLAIARREGIADILLQAAVSNLPVTLQGLARMLTGDDSGDLKFVGAAIARLESLSLLHRFPDGTVWVHRWTPEILVRLGDTAAHYARAVRAGHYRWWRVQNESRALDDAVEALRNFLAGQAFDEATRVAHACFAALHRSQQSMAIAALAAEILETLPETHRGYASVADEEAQAHLAFGLTDRALARYRQLLRRYEQLAQAEPDRADYQRDLIMSYMKMSENVPAEAREHLSRALDIVRSLQSQGRLAPVDAWMVDDLTRRFAGLSDG